ncbi:MAG: hypothetical protein P9X24_05825 [Candidatus Hatepunaea meridiana]|nr:hypothetical protein [Candidatus Hatepunaea meridiana]
MKPKSFDCIKMKRDIHKRMLQEIQGLSREERLAKLEREIDAYPILARIWHRAQRVKHLGKKICCLVPNAVNLV